MSILEYDIRKLVPRFIREDRNGFALMKALEAGFGMFTDILDEAVATWNDPESMPEWRLDELAYEYNIVYDTAADIETKRNWIANAVRFYSHYGTVKGLKDYLAAAFGAASVDEWWNYDGDPFHFRVTVSGEQSESTYAWAQTTVNQVKNVRSVLDSISFNGGSADISLYLAIAATGCEIRTSSICENALDFGEVDDGGDEVIEEPIYS